MDEHPAQILPGSERGNLVPIVVQVVAEPGASDEQPEVLVEAPLGLMWGGTKGSPPAWTELARRADIALKQHGYARTVAWQPHVFPRPLASSTVRRQT